MILTYHEIRLPPPPDVFGVESGMEDGGGVVVVLPEGVVFES